MGEGMGMGMDASFLSERSRMRMMMNAERIQPVPLLACHTYATKERKEEEEREREKKNFSFSQELWEREALKSLSLRPAAAVASSSCARFICGHTHTHTRLLLLLLLLPSVSQSVARSPGVYVLKGEGYYLGICVLSNADVSVPSCKPSKPVCEHALKGEPASPC